MPTVSSSLPDPVLETHIFWDRHKKEVLAALVIALVAALGYAGYRLYADQQNNAAAALLSSAKTGDDFQKVMTQYSGTPASASAYIFLAGEQRREKKYAEANTTLQSFITKYPKHEFVSTARMAMAANLESLGKRDEALTMFQRIAADSPQSFIAPIALMSTVPLLKEKNQIDEARRVCEAIMTQHRESAVSMEATQQLRLLKGGSDSVKSVTATVVNPSAVVSPAPAAIPSAAPPMAAAPPAPSASKPAASPVKKP
jgi:predicted negative regulator of RcsB-dependent stress response